MDNTPLALAAAQTPVFNNARERRAFSAIAEPESGFRGIQVLRGQKQVRSRLARLSHLCQDTGQTDAAGVLAFHMRTREGKKKIPTVVLVGNAVTVGLQGAVIVYEYKIGGCGTGVFVSNDITGRHAVIAPRHLRSQVADSACKALVEEGARAVLVSYEDDGDYSRWIAAEGLCETAARVRSLPLYLPLETTFEATLAALGKHTRRNLRYYRRRAESEMGSTFVPQAEVGRDEFLALNRSSTNPVSHEMARWRYEAVSARRDALLAGVRSRDGRWLSLIGGCRHPRIAEIDWQMNLGGMPRLSLSTVMRSYLLEHEVALGTGKLIFNGGTPHSMRHSFVPADVVDLITLRRSPGGRILRALAPWAVPRRNFLMQALCDPEMQWANG